MIDPVWVRWPHWIQSAVSKDAGSPPLPSLLQPRALSFCLVLSTSPCSLRLISLQVPLFVLVAQQFPCGKGPFTSSFLWGALTTLSLQWA